MEPKMATRIILVNIGVGRLLSRTFSLINEECYITWDLKVHMRRLAANLEKIQALIPDAERKGASSEFVLSWLKRVAVVSSETDILLDECAYENLRFKVEVKDKQREKVLNFFSSSNTVVVKTKLICKVKKINSELVELICGSSIFGLKPVESMVDNNDELEETGETSDSSVIESSGMSEDIKRVTDLLISSHNDRDLSVISIVEKEGGRKKTLAQLMFQDVDVVGKFDKKMWIDVSGEFDILKILKKMFEELTKSDCDLSSREAIIFKLIEILKGQKFLLVLDDVQYMNKDKDKDKDKDNYKDEDKGRLKWKFFMGCLGKIGGSSRSKILLTTPENEVAKAVNSYSVHVLRDQRSEYSSNLPFSEGGASKTARVMEICKVFVTRGGCLPLSVKLMGNLMYSKYESEWLKQTQDGVWHQVLDVQMLDIMKLCYDHLPSLTLKQCFAFCSIFTKGAVIQKEELIQLWMAQGLLYPSKGSRLTMEDRGAKYLDILLRHSFLQEAEEDEFQKGKCCMMPHLLHNLAMLTSKGFCCIMEDILVEDDFQAVHVAMINCRLKLSKKLRGAFEKLRTLSLVDTDVLGDILPYTKYLCSLTVVNLELEELPGSIGRLEHLKLLDISKTRIAKLPDSITKLYGLQTLRLYALQELPKNLENLVSLSHFYVENFEDLSQLNFLPPKFQDLIKRSSFKASFKACLGNEFGIEKLASLEYPDRYSSLKIYRLENVKDYEEATKANLSRMTRIDYLKLHWSGRRENCYDESVLNGLKPHPDIRQLVIENFKGSEFPSWMVKTDQPPLFHKLVRMDLEDCCWCDKIPPLGHLPCLKFVKIQGMDNVKCIGKEFYGPTVSDSASVSSFEVFPALKELTLLGMTNLVEWSGVGHLLNKSSAFPVLEKFEVERCPKITCLPDIVNSSHKHLRRLQIALCDKLTSLPEGLQNLKCLEDLDIRGLPSITLAVKFCNNLTSLTIGGFSSASDVDDHAQNAPESQALLHLKGRKTQLTSLPGELERFSTLRYLTIWGYDGLRALPEWLVSFKSLQTLKLEFCRSLMYFPSAETMRQLTKLDEISISFCPLLEEGCSRGSRLEWHKISHIRKIVINNEAIKFQN